MNSGLDGGLRPEGRNNLPDPSWTPKDQTRPLLPKKGSFGVSQTFPLPDLSVFDSLSDSLRHRYIDGKWEDLSPEAPDGPETP